MPGRFEGAAYRLVQGKGSRPLVYPADEVAEEDQVELGTGALEGFLERARSHMELAVLSLEIAEGQEVRPMAYEADQHGLPSRLVLQLERHRLMVAADGTIVAKPPLGPEDLRVVETWLDRARAAG